VPSRRSLVCDVDDYLQGVHLVAVTSYHSVNRQIVGETTSGTRVDYLSDALGSVTATTNSSGIVQNRYRYKPHGMRLSKTGAASDPLFQWNGRHGYRVCAVGRSYVRARHYEQIIGQWSTQDPLWPEQHQYVYSEANPTSVSDPSGLMCPGRSYPKFTNCPQYIVDGVCDMCNRIRSSSNAAPDAAATCFSIGEELLGRKHKCKTPLYNYHKIWKCMTRWCDTDGHLHCDPELEDAGVTWCPYIGDETNPWDHISLNPNAGTSTFLPRNRPAGQYSSFILVFLHELGHACGLHHENDEDPEPDKFDFQCNDLFACCMYAAMKGQNKGRYGLDYGEYCLRSLARRLGRERQLEDILRRRYGNWRPWG
jgi:RHS repeat-associated protein